MSSEPATPIFQFGTSRFLQAHADLFIHEAMLDNTAAGPITVVQSSGNAERAGRLKALSAPGGFPIRIRGLDGGQTIDREQQVCSVRRTLSTVTDWTRLVRLFADQADYVISNTGDSGFAPQPPDRLDRFEQAMSFPAKLRLLLRGRFHHSARPLTILPMELIQKNGQVLKSRILELSDRDDRAFTDWLTNQIVWADSLVDRIVSEPLEPAGAVAEPYALWAIQKTRGLTPPCRHHCVQLVNDLQEFESLKLFILNLGHTCLVSQWRDMHNPPQTVREFLELEPIRSELMDIYDCEVLPVFASAGREAQARAYMETTMERFRNPFLDHKLSDIAQNHGEKAERRIGGFLKWAMETRNHRPRPRLEAILAGVSSS